MSPRTTRLVGTVVTRNHLDDFIVKCEVQLTLLAQKREIILRSDFSPDQKTQLLHRLLSAEKTTERTLATTWAMRKRMTS